MLVDINFKITNNAIKELKKVISEDNSLKDRYLRVSVQGGGCSGFIYGLGFDDATDSNIDFIENFDGIKVAIDKKSALYLNNVTLDWIDSINNRGFKFDNPNAIKTCGCGKSFQ
jgi:iron-sulfur cluster assembly protein